MSQKIALSTFGSKKCGFIAGSLLHRPGPWSSYNVPLEQVDQCDNFKMRNEITFVVLISDISWFCYVSCAWNILISGDLVLMMKNAAQLFLGILGSLQIDGFSCWLWWFLWVWYGDTPHAKVEDSLLSLEHCDLEVCGGTVVVKRNQSKGDGKLNPIVGVYIPIIRIPIKGGMTIPNIAPFDHGTFEKCVPTKSWWGGTCNLIGCEVWFPFLGLGVWKGLLK